MTAILWRMRLARRAVALVCAACFPSVICNAQVALEYEVKAAFLLNFTKFVEWPPSAFADQDSTFAICILGQDPFGPALDELVAGETVAGRRLTVRRIDRPPAPRACQLVFVGAANKEPAKIMSSVPRGVLTVGEGDHFLHDGGMVALVVENRRVRFDIRQSAAQAADLKLSSKLLSVARTVEK